MQVHAWLLKADTKGGSPLDDDAPATFVFFHGNAGNIGFRLPNAYRMWKLGYNVLMVEYRGYGDSVGEGTGINEKGLKIDAEGVIDWISSCKRVNSDKIFLFGRSLGGAVAFHLAEYAQRKNIRVRGVIVENTFTKLLLYRTIRTDNSTPLEKRYKEQNTGRSHSVMNSLVEKCG